jgi:hypothetical protein
MSTRSYFLGIKAATPKSAFLPPSSADYLEIWEPQPTGTLRNCPDLYRDCFISLVYIYIKLFEYVSADTRLTFS